MVLLSSHELQLLLLLHSQFVGNMSTWVLWKTYSTTLFLHRYEPKTNELINEELGIAYPVIDGIPNMIPQEARLIRKDASDTPAQ